MDLEDKLKLLRKEREVRRRAVRDRADARNRAGQDDRPPGQNSGRGQPDPNDVAANDAGRIAAGDAVDADSNSPAPADSARAGRGRTVEETWRKIETGEESLSVKEKLERLINLTGTGWPARRPAGSSAGRRRDEPPEQTDADPGDPPASGLSPDSNPPGGRPPARLFNNPADRFASRFGARQPTDAFLGDAFPAAPAPPILGPGGRRAREPFRFLENPFTLDSRYGRIPISLGLEVPGDVLAFLGRDGLFETLDLSTALFLDLETTGLAGGTGTVPFLVGMGYYRDDRFRIAQFFLNDLAEEERMIRELARFFVEMGFRSVVTYNGKAFDLPILETRFILHRSRFPLASLPHLDFLFSARSLWRHKHDSCRLGHLAQQIVEAPRDEDIPGAEIPLRYFQFIRTGDDSLIEPILDHNQEDILSLLGVVVAGSLLVAKSRGVLESGDADALDLFGLARLFEGAGQLERSASLMQQALESGLRGEISGLARKKLSCHFKKTRDWSKAVSLWQDAESGDELYCRRELAMYFEHREKNFEEAIRAAEEGLALSLERMSGTYRQDFEHRLERLRGKLRRRH